MAETSLRILFAGTPEFSALHLKALIDSKHQLIGVYTQPDRPAGRGKKLQASPVKNLALEAGLAVYQPASLKEAGRAATAGRFAGGCDDCRCLWPDPPASHTGCSTAGLPECTRFAATALARCRTHTARYRGWRSGLGNHHHANGCRPGYGGHAGHCELPHTAATTAASLHDELAMMGAPLLLQVLSRLNDYQLQATTQDDALSTYARKILKSEAQLDWRHSATQLDRPSAPLIPFPSASAPSPESGLKSGRQAPLPQRLQNPALLSVPTRGDYGELAASVA